MNAQTNQEVWQLFAGQFNAPISKISQIVSDALHNTDDGELFLEARQNEILVFDDQKLRSANYNINSGFGFRAVISDATGYAYSSELSIDSLQKAASTATSIKNYSMHKNIAINHDHYIKPYQVTRYGNFNPLQEVTFSEKIKLLQEIDEYIRSKNPLVKQVSVTLAGDWQAVQIIRSDDFITSDIRPLTRLNISVIVEKNGRMEMGYYGAGGRTNYQKILSENNWKQYADTALAQALVNLDSIPAPAGEMQVVLGPGWPGILLHEAIGHGLESDFNRKKVSAFSELMGKQIAAKGVTIVDDGTIPDRRGSLNIDDEGTPAQKNILIDDGILVSYMHDRMNARLMDTKPTGNGRRESFAHQPMPRMTNTYMLAGNTSKEDIISSVKKGIYAVSFGGGQVDITSGKFVFSSQEAYLIENGKITAPVKGATLIGNGPDVLTKIRAVGNDAALDPGIGVCGKAGQSVPVGVGQPTLLVDALTVGGTST